MGVSSSTSLSKLRENIVLQRFVGEGKIEPGDDFWDQLLSFSYATPTDSVCVHWWGTLIVASMCVGVHASSFNGQGGSIGEFTICPSNGH